MLWQPVGEHEYPDGQQCTGITGNMRDSVSEIVLCCSTKDKNKGRVTHETWITMFEVSVSCDTMTMITCLCHHSRRHFPSDSIQTHRPPNRSRCFCSNNCHGVHVEACNGLASPVRTLEFSTRTDGRRDIVPHSSGCDSCHPLFTCLLRDVAHGSVRTAVLIIRAADRPCFHR